MRDDALRKFDAGGRVRITDTWMDAWPPVTATEHHTCLVAFPSPPLRSTGKSCCSSVSPPSIVRTTHRVTRCPSSHRSIGHCTQPKI